jgi:8-oxo-dGTP pyrophosphatase MutT (NUDIX family)
VAEVVSLAASSAPNRLPDDWALALRRCLLTRPDHTAGRWRLADVQSIPAAVLVPVIDRGADSSVLLTVRASALRHHAGQISFPGGRMETDEADPVQTALRETQEEIGIAASHVEPLGMLPDHRVLTGFRITPVVALIKPGFALRLASDEVADVIEVPLGFVLQPANYQRVQRRLKGFDVQGWDCHLRRT